MTAPAIAIHDLHPTPNDFLGEVLAGLRKQHKTLPCKYFYDARGSALFDRICESGEYYPTRTELRILERHGHEIAETLGPQCALIEFGSGRSLKTQLLLSALDRPKAYVPIDISRDHLRAAAERIAARFPHLCVRPTCADFAGKLSLPALPHSVRRRVVFFPGSTIGNFAPAPRLALLQRIVSLLEPEGGTLLIGLDLIKDVATMERAYNDAGGLTREFNLNLLHRINNELGANFHTRLFEHHALYNEAESRIEMHLVSRMAQHVEVPPLRFSLRAGESIRTECSYKFSIAAFGDEAGKVGLVPEVAWTDEYAHFAILSLRTSRSPLTWSR